MSYRIQRRFPAVGDIRISVGSKKAYDRYNVLLTELYEDGRVDILSAIRDRKRTLQEVYQARRTTRLSYLSVDMEVFRNLWEAVEATVPRMGRKQSTRDRYDRSFKHLRKHLADDTTVDDLARVEWQELLEGWTSAADWNRLRSAVSRFLSILLDDKYHPFRRAVLKRFPRADEGEGRVPELSVPLFWRIVDRMPDELKPLYVAMAVTGLRPGEFVALRPEHLLPLTREIRVPGTKTDSSRATIAVGPDAWPYVEASVPCPLTYRKLYDYWKTAVADEKASDLTLHDIRHLYGQQLADAGHDVTKIQDALRHKTPAMSLRYMRRAAQHESAAVIASRILSPPRHHLEVVRETGRGS